MEKKTSETINGICTILGGALLLYPLIDEATKTIIPEMQKLTSGETIHELTMLPIDSKKHEHDKEDPEEKTQDNEIAELKRKLAEYERKSGEQENN